MVTVYNDYQRKYMNWDDVFKIVAASVASIGTASVIIAGLASFLGKVWIGRILEEKKQKNRVDLESVKNSFEIRMENIKVELSRLTDQSNMRFEHYSKAQFELYSKLWSSLIDLKDHVEELWANANSLNLRRFISSLRNAKVNIQKTAIILEHDHYTQMMKLIEHFEQYKMGKSNLIELRRRSQNTEINQIDVSDIIDSNRDEKETIIALIDRILLEMREQINGREK